jgi:membrane protease YdiL (CAAX protease family)
MPANENESSALRMAVLVEGGLAVLAVVAAGLFGVQLREQLPDTRSELAAAVIRGVVATLPLVLALWWLVHVRWPAAQRLRQQAQRLIAELFHRASLAQLALVAVLAGVGEELLFRGVLQTLVGRWTNDLSGLVVASLIFGLFHALSMLYFVLATLVGAYFGWLVLQYHDLTSAIIAHALYDFVALWYLRRDADN